MNYAETTWTPEMEEKTVRKLKELFESKDPLIMRVDPPVTHVESKLEDMMTTVAGKSTNPETLEWLATTPYSMVRWTVAENYYVTEETLTILSNDKNWLVRRSVAGNSKTPIAILEKLAKDAEYGVRAFVAANPSTPISLLKALAEENEDEVDIDGDENRVLHAIAKNRRATSDILDIVARKIDYSSNVYDALLDNPNLSDATLAYMDELENED